MALSDAQKRATRKYNDKTYRDFRTPIRKELFEEINNWCKDRGISRAEFIRRAQEVPVLQRRGRDPELHKQVLRALYQVRSTDI